MQCQRLLSNQQILEEKLHPFHWSNKVIPNTKDGSGDRVTFLNPDIREPSSAFSSKNESICFGTIFSKIFDRAGRIETGRKSSGHFGWSFFGIGEILAVFHILGNEYVTMHWLMIWVNSDARKEATGMITFTGIWSTPVEHSQILVPALILKLH